MPKGFSVDKKLKRLILGLIAVAIIILVVEIFFRPKPIYIPVAEKTFPKIEIDWELLREPLEVVAPELSVSLTANPTSTATSSPVTLLAEIPGLIEGPFTYRFDCDNDGNYELEIEQTLEKVYEVPNVCVYEKEGIYTAKVKVTADLSYYLKPGEKLIETKTAEGTAEVLIAIINTAPEISFCDVVPVKGTTQANFKFIFRARAADLDGDPLEFEWDFGDGEVSNEQNPLYTYKKPGGYIPKLSVSDGRGGTDKCLVFSLTPLKAFLPFEPLIFVEEAGRDNPFSPYSIGEIGEIGD